MLLDAVLAGTMKIGDLFNEHAWRERGSPSGCPKTSSKNCFRVWALPRFLVARREQNGCHSRPINFCPLSSSWFIFSWRVLAPQFRCFSCASCPPKSDGQAIALSARRTLNDVLDRFKALRALKLRGLDDRKNVPLFSNFPKKNRSFLGT